MGKLTVKPGQSIQRAIVSNFFRISQASDNIRNVKPPGSVKKWHTSRLQSSIGTRWPAYLPPSTKNENCLRQSKSASHFRVTVNKIQVTRRVEKSDTLF
jgi:hypothetical protein